MMLIQAYPPLKFRGILEGANRVMYYNIAQFIITPTGCSINAVDLKKIQTLKYAIKSGLF